MALSLPRLTLAIQNAFVAGGAVPGNPLLIAMSAAFAQGIIDELGHADVDPLGTPPLTAPPGGGPVTGKGKIT